ncbi:hypothetical protein CP02DC22_1160A, partial [Chlamydia psittaci 02DC22]
MRLIAP